MIKPAWVGGVLGLALAVCASGEEYPLTFKTIAAKDVMSFPGGYGVYAQLHPAKPDALRKEPRAISSQPLYGECEELGGGTGWVFRLDESKGTGRGYDQLLLDLNGNGDLTDETPASLASPPGDSASSTRRGPLLFGPIPTPASAKIAGGQPVFFARANVITVPRTVSSANLRDFYAGQLVLKAGWYLEATVNFEDRQRKLGVFDGDSNLRLGDTSQPSTYGTGSEKSWYFGSADSWLVDADGSGAFESDPFQSESSPMGSILYVGARAYQVSIGSGCRTLRVTPWTEPLAEVALEPRGDQVRRLALAWSRPGGKWQLLQPTVSEGKIRVPPGIYRLYGCGLHGSGAVADQVMAAGTLRLVREPVTFVTGQANRLRCGAPLDLRVQAEKRIGSPTGFRGVKGPGDSDYVLRISAKIAGAGTEIYSSFAKGARLDGEPPKPAFRIADAGGRELGNGNLEFG